MITIGMITFNTNDARKLSAWWAERLQGEVIAENDGWFCVVRVPESPVTLAFQKVEHPLPEVGRMHLDLDHRLPGQSSEALVSEWVSAGATHLGRRGENGFYWDTFADPEGNEFCIGDPHE